MNGEESEDLGISDSEIEFEILDIDEGKKDHCNKERYQHVSV